MAHKFMAHKFMAHKFMAHPIARFCQLTDATH